MKLRSLLITPERDYLISNDGAEVNVDELDHKVVCLYFATSSSDSLFDSPNERCRGFTSVLAKVYAEMRTQNHEFEVVLVSLDRDLDCFEAHYETMPWLAIPYQDTAARLRLRDEFNVEFLPRLIVFDKEGHLWESDGYELVKEHGAEAFSSKLMSKPVNLESLFGSRSTLLKHQLQEVNISDVKEKTIGLFFSAHSSRRARSFTRKLIKAYEEVRGRGEEFEIIFISSDHDLQSFMAYYETMPWLAVPFEDVNSRSSLVTQFQVRQVPSLIILDALGGVVTTEGCLLVQEFGSAAFPFTKSRLSALRSLDDKSFQLSGGRPEDDEDHHQGTQIWITNNAQPGLNQCVVCKRFGSGWGFICNDCSRSRRSWRPRLEAGDEFHDYNSDSDHSEDRVGSTSMRRRSYRRSKSFTSNFMGRWIDSETKRTLIGSLFAGLLTAVVGVCSYCCSKLA